MKSLKVVTYGTRGSIPISRADSTGYGGNTTSLRIFSECLPEGVALVVDGGSGYVTLSNDLLLKEKIMKVWMLITHYHHDHTQGIPMATHTYFPTAEMTIWGPKEHNLGPHEVMAQIMQAPFFPVNYPTVRHRFNCKSLENIGTQVLVIHPKGGSALLQNHVYETIAKNGRQLPFGKDHYPIDECLVIKMFKTVHPEYTVSYRIEEKPTGKVFVFLTDHENTDALPNDFLRHLKGADLLIQDCQYSRAKYDSQTAGFGHGTPDYCARTAAAAGVKRLGLTHHDPNASDEDVNARLREAIAYSEEHQFQGLEIFACRDYGEIEV